MDWQPITEIRLCLDCRNRGKWADEPKCHQFPEMDDLVARAECLGEYFAPPPLNIGNETK
jgi:hypothetical protein